MHYGALLAAFLVSAYAYAFAGEVDEIVRRSCERAGRNVELLQEYTYKLHQNTRKLNGQDGAKEVNDRTVEVLYIDGTAYRRTVEKNGKPLGEREARDEQEKMDREIAKRKRESPAARAKRIAERQKELEEDRRMRLEVPKAYDFALLGVESVNGRPCWKVQAEPKPGYQPGGKAGKILPKLHGSLWIDQQNYQWAKIDAESLDTLSMGFGVFRIGKGFRLQLEQEFLNNELWVPKTAKVNVNAKALFVVGGNFDLLLRFYDYRRYTVDSTITAVSDASQ